MKWCTFFFYLMPVAMLAQAEPDKLGAKITHFEAGVICAPPTAGVSKAPGTVAGTTHLIAVDPPFVSTKRRVPAVIGIGFGVKARALNPAGIDDVRIVISHPPMGDQGTIAQTFESRISGLDPSLTFYQFDFDYELVTGIWQMQAMQGTLVLYRTTFEVLPPSQVPELATICGFETLSS
tara:strand:+ start:10163 stop:10699 length:537 start_codon:yes stop_codon:yes gene_type:complete